MTAQIKEAPTRRRVHSLAQTGVGRHLGSFALVFVLVLLIVGANPFRQTLAPMDLLLAYPGWDNTNVETPLVNRERSDALDHRLPNWREFRRELREGRLPLWNPLHQLGAPGIQSPIYEGLSIPFLVYAATPDEAVGYTLAILANYFVASFGAYCLLYFMFGNRPRRHFRSLGLRVLRIQYCLGALAPSNDERAHPLGLGLPTAILANRAIALGLWVRAQYRSHGARRIPIRRCARSHSVGNSRRRAPCRRNSERRPASRFGHACRRTGICRHRGHLPRATWPSADCRHSCVNRFVLQVRWHDTDYLQSAGSGWLRFHSQGRRRANFLCWSPRSRSKRRCSLFCCSTTKSVCSLRGIDRCFYFGHRVRYGTRQTGSNVARVCQ